MTQSTKNTITEVTRQGDWVIPVMKKNGDVVYALQINKTQVEKDNWDTILSEYQNAGVEVLTYKGKNDNDVFLVNSTEKLHNKRVGVKKLAMISKLVNEKGFSQKEAEEFANSL